MFYLTVRNVGPISEADRVEITPFTLISGKQCSGKSTLMKILSHCAWFEKQLMIKDDKFLYLYSHNQKFLTELKRFHRLDEYEFSANSLIVYESELVRLELQGNKKNVKVTKCQGFKELVHNYKISYIPSERSFLFAIPNIETVYRSDHVDNLFNFILEWRESKTRFTSNKPLDVVVTHGMRYYYDMCSDRDVIELPNKRRISPIYASSGVQSSLPIIVMANYLHSIIGETYYSVRDYVQNSDLDKFKYRYFKLFIEEPEQNLFPEAQYELLRLLVSLLKPIPSSSLILTSHSPYILTSINILIKASLACKKDREQTLDLIPEELLLPQKTFSAYFMDEDGRVENMIDPETSLIRGEYLDSVGEIIDEKTYELNKILYDK